MWIVNLVLHIRLCYDEQIMKVSREKLLIIRHILSDEVLCLIITDLFVCWLDHRETTERISRKVGWRMKGPE